MNIVQSSSGPRGGCALFVASSSAMFAEMLRLADRLRCDRGFRCVFAFTNELGDAAEQKIAESPYQSLRLYADSPSKAGLASDAGQRRPAAKLLAKLVAKLQRKATRWRRRLPFLNSWRSNPTVQSLFESKQIAERLIAQTQPDIVLLGGDRGAAMQTFVAAAAREAQIPSLSIPWAISCDNDVALFRRLKPHWQETFGNRRRINQQAAKRWPAYLCPDDGEWLLYYPAEVLYALDALGVRTEHPWHPNGFWGIADHYAVEGQRVLDEAVEHGSAPERITVTGRIVADHLVARSEDVKHRAAVRERYAIAAEEQMLVCAVPQLAEHQLSTWDQHRRDLDSLFAALGGLRANAQTQVVLSLHPKSRLADYQAVAAKFGLRIADEPLEDLIPACDGFACCASSTVAYAIGLRKPIVLLDYLLPVSYALFDQCPGALHATTLEMLPQTLQQLMTDPAARARLAAEQNADASQWTRSDGQCGRRLLDLVESLISSSVRAATPAKLPSAA